MRYTRRQGLLIPGFCEQGFAPPRLPELQITPPIPSIAMVNREFFGQNQPFCSGSTRLAPNTGASSRNLNPCRQIGNAHPSVWIHLNLRILYPGRETAKVGNRKTGGHSAGPKQVTPVDSAAPIFTLHKARGLKSGVCEAGGTGIKDRLKGSEAVADSTY